MGARDHFFQKLADGDLGEAKQQAVRPRRSSTQTEAELDPALGQLMTILAHAKVRELVARIRADYAAPELDFNSAQL